VAQRYIGQSIATIDDEDSESATVSLVGSHLQNICIEVEAGYAELSFIMSPRGARKLIAAMEKALAEAATMSDAPAQDQWRD